MIEWGSKSWDSGCGVQVLDRCIKVLCMKLQTLGSEICATEHTEGCVFLFVCSVAHPFIQGLCIEYLLCPYVELCWLSWVKQNECGLCLKESQTGGEGMTHHRPEKDESQKSIGTWGRTHNALITASLRSLGTDIYYHDLSPVSLLLATKAEGVSYRSPLVLRSSVQAAALRHRSHVPEAGSVWDGPVPHTESECKAGTREGYCSAMLTGIKYRVQQK